jgi:hypothetical protein
LICAYCFNEVRAAEGVCSWCGERARTLPAVRVSRPPLRSTAPRTPPDASVDAIVPRAFLGLWGFGACILGLAAFELVPSLAIVICGYAALAVVSTVCLGRHGWAWWTSMLVLATPLGLAALGAMMAAGELRGEGCGCAMLVLFVVGVMTLLPMGVLWANRPTLWIRQP